MVFTVPLAPATPADDAAAWSAFASTAERWMAEHAIDPRDAIVLVPFAQLLPLARRAFRPDVSAPRWMPRTETTRSLAESLGPAPRPQPDQLALDPVLDRLTAAHLLRSQAGGDAWSRRDRRDFERAVGDVVDTAHAFAHAAAAVPPPERTAYWTRARSVLASAAGPAAGDRVLARIALEWAALAPPPATDRLYGLRPAAWIALGLGGADALTAGVMTHASPDTPCLLVDADASGDPIADAAGSDTACPTAAALIEASPSPCFAPGEEPALAVCDGFESEAQSCAAQVLEHLRLGQRPVALIAQDRLLVRRVRALLDRQQIAIRDETGWALSTTRAAARVVRLLDAARPGASADDAFDWLKSATAWALDAAGRRAIATLETACRRARIHRADRIATAVTDPAAADRWSCAGAVLAELAGAERRSLHRWLAALRSALDGCGALALLQADAAGRQVLAALRLDDRKAELAGAAWRHRADAAEMTLGDVTGWVRSVLEDARFVPPAPDGDAAPVVVTPLARALWRPFAARVVPGADDRHLGGGSGGPPSLVGDAQAAALGLPTAAERRRREQLGFFHVATAPRVTLLRRRVDGVEPLAASPWLERLEAALTAQGRSLQTWRDPRLDLVVAASPLGRSGPRAPSLLPARLSASSLEALRACPYRFFALQMLKLREADELSGEVEKRDYGSWLHAVLHRFHAGRSAPRSLGVDVGELERAAGETTVEQGLDPAGFVPYAATFAQFAPQYAGWLQRRDATGARWWLGEEAVETAADGIDGLTLVGVIDRVDRVGQAGRAGDAGDGDPAEPEALELIDYKTGSASGLKARVREPLEDTQLAFYAALMRSRTAAPLTASYLALDTLRGIEAIEHVDVEASARELQLGLQRDVARLRAGARLPALGEGDTCRHCAARGLCRRDHWSPDASA